MPANKATANIHLKSCLRLSAPPVIKQFVPPRVLLPRKVSVHVGVGVGCVVLLMVVLMLDSELLVVIEGVNVVE